MIVTKRAVQFTALSLLLLAGAARAQQYPIMDMVADNIIHKYQNASCQQLWQHRGKPKTQKEKEAIQLLHNDPQMRNAFINKVAAPIANKMFECGMIP
jgi:hypothetical protein